MGMSRKGEEPREIFAEPCFSLEKALEIVEGEVDLLKEIVQLFIQGAEEKVPAIKQGVEEKDFEKVVYNAHSLKGGAGSIAAFGFRALCENIEKAGRNRDMEKIAESFDLLQAEFERLKKERSTIDWDGGEGWG